MTAADRMRRMRERRKADGLKPVVSWVPHSESTRPGYSSHRLLEAGREKDLEFTRELARHGLTDSKVLVQRLKETEVPMEVRKLIEARIRRDSAQTKKR